MGPTLNPILSVIDSAVGLWLLVFLLIPGKNFIKTLAIPLLVLDTLFILVIQYPETRDAIITILGWINK